MSNSTFSGPVRATDGFLEKDEAGNWVPVSGGGGPAITFGGMFGGSSWDGSTPLAVAIQPSGVVAGVYDNPTIAIDAEGRITNAVNGTLPSAPNGVKFFLVSGFSIGGSETSIYFYQQLPANARVVDVAIKAQVPINYPDFSTSTLRIGGVDALYMDFRSAASEVGGNAFFNGNPGIESGSYYSSYTYPDGSSAVPLDITLSNPDGLGGGSVDLIIQYIDVGA